MGVPQGGRKSKFAKLLRKEGKETKTKRVRPWLQQVEAYLETQHLEMDKGTYSFHSNIFQRTFMGLLDVSKVGNTPFEAFTWEEFKLTLNKRFMPFHLMFKDGMELLEFA